MKRKILIVLILSLLLLTACNRVEITLPPDTSSDINSSTDDTSTESIPDLSSQPDSSGDDNSNESSDTESDDDPNESEPGETVKINYDFSFPEEFYEELFELLIEHEVNPECGFSFDLTEEEYYAECGCDPMLLLEGNADSTGPSDGSKIPEQRVVSVYFKDLTSGYELVYNPYPHYPVASIIKLPFILYTCSLVEQGEFSLEDEFEYKEKHYFGGTGVIKEEEYGTVYPLSELIRLSLEKSDNVAYEMLKDYIGTDNFSDYLKSNGIEHFEDYRTYTVRLCAETAGRYAEMLYEYLETESELSLQLKEWLKTSEAILATTANGTLYHKYGWADISFHDSAYIECEYPYVIGYATNLEGTWDDFTLLRQMSLLIERYHNEFYEKADESLT